MMRWLLVTSGVMMHMATRCNIARQSMNAKLRWRPQTWAFKLSIVQDNPIIITQS